MNKIIYKVFTVSAFLLLITTLLMQGCSKQSDNLVTAPTSIYHGDGWLTPSSTNFHGAVIKANDWNLDYCKSCHGNDYKGGNTQTGCFNCHQNGPEGCNVCHGNSQNIYPPKSLSGHLLPTEQGVGAHDIHLTLDSAQRFSARVSCFECHLPVSSFRDTNHIGLNPGTAEVVFGTLAKTLTPGYSPNPIWDRNTQKCSNVYCHGYFKNGNPTAQPTFTDPNSVVCGSCHGDPNTGNPKPITGHQYFPDKCWYCHSTVIDSNNVIINKYRHINGVVDYNIK
jgi:predicted CxxxxCH...CXXCH cytochrome family protein